MQKAMKVEGKIMTGSVEIREMIEYYRSQGAPQDQQMLIALLREMQEAEGGVLTDDAMDTAAQLLGLKVSLLLALIRRIPGLRYAAAPHRLEICGTCRAGAKLRGFIEKTYSIKSGGIHENAGFSYRVVPCMKNCKNGPSIRWDGKLYSRADEAMVKALIGKAK